MKFLRMPYATSDQELSHLTVRSGEGLRAALGDSPTRPGRWSHLLRLPGRAGKCALVLTVMMSVHPNAPLAAEDLRVATQNMKNALELCLRNYRSAAALPVAFTSAGYTVRSGLDTGVHEFSAPGVYGGFVENYCIVQSSDVPLAIAEDLGRRMAEALFPGKVELGDPEKTVSGAVPPCEGLSIFAPQKLIRVTYAVAGTSGACGNDGTSAVIVNM